MSRVKTILVAIILVVGILLPTTTLASPGTTVSITDATLPTGATGSVVLSISAAESVSCVDVDVSYDPAVVEVTGASGSDFDSLVSNIENDHTHLVAFVTSQTGLTGTIKVADITLTSLGGESSLTLDVITLKDNDGNPIPFTVISGLVTGVPTGTVVSITNATLATGAAGSVTLSISGATEPVSSTTIDVSYDPAVVEVTGASGSDFDSLVSNIENDHTRLVAFVTSETGLTGTIKVADITLKRLGGESALTLDVVTLKDDDGNPVPFTVVNGIVTIRPAGGGGGIGRRPPAGTTDIRGLVGTGCRFTESATAFSDDELCTLTIPEDTVGLTEELDCVDEITILREDDPPPPPEGADIVLAYDLGPDGATFEPAVTLTFSYDPDDIHEGKDVLVVAYYDEIAEAWVYLEGEVDTVSKTVTVSISHFTCFAIIARAPSPTPVPATFTPGSLVISPTEVDTCETVNVSISVANTGDMEGSCTVVLKINGAVEATQEVTVDAGASEEVTFAVSRCVAGSYSVDVNGLSGSFMVKEAVPPPEEEEVVVPEIPAEVPPAINWPVFGLVIAAVVVAGVLIFLLIRRREVRA